MVEHRSKSKSCSVALMGYQTAIFYYESANSHLLKSEKHGQQWPAKADISPPSSPLGHISRGRMSAAQRQKFHTDDIKSVWNPVISTDWMLE